jgi:hypothetical protein
MALKLGGESGQIAEDVMEIAKIIHGSDRILF